MAVADLSGTPPLRPKMFSISCSFSDYLAKSYVGTPPGVLSPLLRAILDPPLQGLCFVLCQVKLPRTRVFTCLTDFEKSRVITIYLPHKL